MNTPIIVLMITLVIGCFIYGVAIRVIIYGLTRIENITSHSNTCFISVIIAARNERNTISSCLAALASQDYQPDMFEVIVADDRSIDHTGEVVNRFLTIIKNMALIRIETVPQGISPKKNALTQAIKHAKGEIILQTDADCIPPVNWISGIASRFDNKINMVVGVAPYFKAPGMLNSFIRHEYIWNAALAAASISLGHGTHASGRNLAFRKKIFDQLEGYGNKKDVQSGDDTLLLQQIRKLNSGSVKYLPSRETHVYTYAPRAFSSFLRQRTRHMSTGKFFDPFLIVLGLIIYGFHMLLLSTLLLSVFSAWLFLLFLAGFIVKCLADAFTARCVRDTIGLEVEWKQFLHNEFFLLIYMSVMPLLGLLVPVTWKEK